MHRVFDFKIDVVSNIYLISANRETVHHAATAVEGDLKYGQNTEHEVHNL